MLSVFSVRKALRLPLLVFARVLALFNILRVHRLSFTMRLGLLLSLGFLLFGVLAKAQRAEIDPRLQDQLFAEGHADVLVMFDNFPDLSGAADFVDKADKGRFVVAALRQNATRHASLLSKLDQQQVAYEHFWAANAIYVPKANEAILQLLAQEAGVYRIANLESWQLTLPDNGLSPEIKALQARAVTPEWGLRYMNVPAVWDLGVRGEGTVVGGQDTGYDWTHPALQSKYRGYISPDSANHNYNWHDAIQEDSPLTTDTTANPCGYQSQVPCDDQSHGTHTMGTMVGSDSTHQTGVAPDAEWVACRSMERGWGRPETYLECFQWFLAPSNLDGENLRPDLAPDVIANSWYCPLIEGCDSTTFPAFDNVTQALRAAGVVVVVSAGNEGASGCGTINRIPALSPGVISVGAHDSLGMIAGFSSKGSAALGMPGPGITAPGVAVRSTTPGNNYRIFSGTSMSGPHLAGLVALMISARPELRGQVDTIEAILYRTAITTPAPADDSCSVAGGPNMVFGSGTANALAAVQAAQAWGGISGATFVKTLDVNFAPNPIGAGFTLTTPESAIGATLEIVDITGRNQVYLSKIKGPKSFILSDQWPAGTYVYRIRSKAGNAHGKLVKF